MNGLAEMSDDELRTLIDTPEDNLRKQRARAQPRPAPSPHAHLSDAEVLAAIQGPAKPLLPDYSGEDSDLGPSTRANVRATAQVGQALSGKYHGDLDMRDARWEELRQLDPMDQSLSPKLRELAAQARMRPQDVEGTPENTAHGFKDFAGGQLVGMGLGQALRAVHVPHVLTNVGAGAGAGAAQTLTSGSSRPMDLLTATLGGAAMGGVAGGLGPRTARPPQTQREMDAAALAMAPREPAGLAQGEHGTVELANRANEGLNARISQRQTEQGGAMNEAERDFSRLDHDVGPAPTGYAIARLEQLRQESYGGSKPTLDSDRPLRNAQENLTTPGGYPGAPPVQYVPRAALRNVGRGLNDEAFKAGSRNADMSRAALQQGAGIVSDVTRSSDPRLGPGNMGGALDRFGAEADRLNSVSELRGPESGRVTKLARVGSANESSAPGAIQDARDVAQLQREEPASNDLIDMIRARNTRDRRALHLPSLSPMVTSPAYAAARGVRQQASNLAFKLHRPQIDVSTGNVAARNPRLDFSPSGPLELQMMLEHRKQQQENENASQ